MTFAKIYNLSLLTSLLLIGAGVACLSIPAALIAVGALVLLLTLRMESKLFPKRSAD
jgi:hypothetical protein